jgi:EpsI family protein
MMSTLAASWWLTPRHYWFDEIGRPDLERIVPRRFGNWVADEKSPALMVNPELAETLRVIYSQTLARTYVNQRTGRVIMLSIAVGIDQSRTTQLHLPEGCYRTQGFTVDYKRYDLLDSPAGAVKLTRLATHAQARREPVSYWIRVGKWNARGPLEMNLSRLALAAHGYIADGVLFRVSEISGDPESSFHTQDQFMNDLIAAVEPSQRTVLTGLPTS